MSSFASSIRSLLRKDTRVRLDELTDFAPEEGTREEIVFWFSELVGWLRPRAGQRVDTKIKFLTAHLEQHAERRARVVATLTRLVEETAVHRFLVSAGIPHDFHLGGAIREWFIAATLPAACKTDDGAEVLRIALRESDMHWVEHRSVIRFFHDLLSPECRAGLAARVDDALIDLAHQVVAQAHLPGMRTLAKGERGPFDILFARVDALVREPASLGALVGVRACVRDAQAAIEEYRSHLAERGADINTTFSLGRLHGQLRRLDRLSRILHHPEGAPAELPAMVKQVLRHAQGDHLVSRSTELVTQNVVDTAASVGQKYLDKGNESYRAAFLAGAGGGALMAVATFVKFAIVSMHLPVIYEGLVASLNYAATFCAAYLLHFTIATKLPAHTAATLARSVQSHQGFRARLDTFVAAWRAALKLQIAGLLGNVLVCGPLAFGIAKGIELALGHTFVDATKASSIMQSHSVLGPSVLYAGLAGVFLWASSLIGALTDNWTRLNRVADRFATSRLGMKRLGRHAARRLADALTSKWGGLVGNASLGFMLGAIPAAFAVAQLPIEIRHITVSTGSVAIALSTGSVTTTQLGLAIGGLVSIAAANVAVSFLLALWFAMRASRSTASADALLRIGLSRWARGRSAEVQRAAGRTTEPPAHAEAA